MVSKNLDNVQKKWILGPKICILLCYTHINPNFWGQTDPTQWDHNITISWGNSGYLLFSGRWPFGRSAGRFMAPIAQHGPFWAQKCCFEPKILFLWTSSQYFATIMTGHQKDNVFVLLMLLGKLLGVCKGPFLARKSDFLRYTHKAPFFWAQTDPTHLDHNIPISWGKSGHQ